MRTLVLLWLSGAALRATILALPPVLPQVTADLRQHANDTGLLAGRSRGVSGLPVLAFLPFALTALLVALPGATLGLPEPAMR